MSAGIARDALHRARCGDDARPRRARPHVVHPRELQGLGAGNPRRGRAQRATGRTRTGTSRRSPSSTRPSARSAFCEMGRAPISLDAGTYDVVHGTPCKSPISSNGSRASHSRRPSSSRGTSPPLREVRHARSPANGSRSSKTRWTPVISGWPRLSTGRGSGVAPSLFSRAASRGQSSSTGSTPSG